MQKVLLVAVMFVFFSFDKPKLGWQQVDPGIRLLVPRTWRPMDELDFSQRYPSVRAPLAGFTDADRLADLSVNISATQWPGGQSDIAKEFFKASILNTFDRVDMIGEGVREVKGKELVYFEFESTVKGNPREMGQREAIMMYNYLAYHLGADRTLVFSFHCPRRLKPQWQETAQKIMENIRIK